MRFFHISHDDILLGVLNCVTHAKRTRGVDGVDTLDITCSDSGISKGDRIVFTDSQGLGAEYLVQAVQASRSDEMPFTTFQCVNGIAELNDVYVEDLRGVDSNAHGRLSALLETTRWSVGRVENGTLEQRSDYAFYHTTVLKAIQALCKKCGLEAETSVTLDGNHVVNRCVNLIEHRGAKDPTKRFEYARDLKSIKRTINASQIVTRLYVWGKTISHTTPDKASDGSSDISSAKKIVTADENLEQSEVNNE